jgi:hypothetical protein
MSFWGSCSTGGYHKEEQRRASRHRGGHRLIQDDKELEVTKERIAFFQSMLAQLRVTATLEEFPYVASGYRFEIERMQAEALEHLTRRASEPIPVEVS